MNRDLSQKITRLNNYELKNTAKKALVFYHPTDLGELASNNNLESIIFIEDSNISTGSAYYIKLNQPENNIQPTNKIIYGIYGNNEQTFNFPFSVKGENGRKKLKQGFPAIVQKTIYTLDLNLTDNYLNLSCTNIDINISLEKADDEITIQIHYNTKPVITFKITGQTIKGIKIKKGEEETTKNFNDSINITSLVQGPITITPTHYNEDGTIEKLSQGVPQGVFNGDYKALSNLAFKDVENKQDEYAYVLKRYPNEEIEIPLAIYNNDTPFEIKPQTFYWSNSVNKIQWGNLLITKLETQA